MADDNARDNGHARHMDRWLLWIRPVELIIAFLLGMYVQGLRYGDHEKRINDLEQFRKERVTALDNLKDSLIAAIGAFRTEQERLHGEINANLQVLQAHIEMDERRFDEIYARKKHGGG